MSVTSTPVFTQAIKTAVGTLGTLSTTGQKWTIDLTSTTNLVTLVTAGTNGARVTSLIASTTDTAANDLFIILNAAGAAGNLTIIGQVHIPAGSGTVASTPSVDLLNSSNTPGLPIDNNGKRFIHLQSGDILYFGTVANLSADKIVFVAAQYENY